MSSSKLVKVECGEDTDNSSGNDDKVMSVEELEEVEYETERLEEDDDDFDPLKYIVMNSRIPANTQSSATKRMRSTSSQMRMLIEFISSHPRMVDGVTPAHKREWERMRRVLATAGPDKSVQQWKISWRDLKRRARDEHQLMMKAKQNNDPPPRVSLNSQLILDAMEQCGDELVFRSTNKDPNRSTDTTLELPKPISPKAHPRSDPLASPPLPAPPTSGTTRMEKVKVTAGRPRPEPREPAYSKDKPDFTSNTTEVLENICSQMERSNRLKEEQNNILRDLLSMLRRNRSS